jgi:hypothetical protein
MRSPAGAKTSRRPIRWNKLFFDCAQLMTQGGLGKTESLAGTGQAALLHRGPHKIQMA